MSVERSDRSEEERYNNRYIAPTSAGRLFEASWDEGAESRIVNTFGRIKAIDYLDRNQADRIDPEIINKEFNIGATGPTTRVAAQYIMDVQTEKRKRAAIIANGSDSFLTGTAMPFLAVAASSVADPVDFAIAALLGGATTAITAGRAISAGAKFGLALAENATASALTEVMVLGAEDKELGEYTAQEAFTNVLAGSFLMTGAFHLGGAGLRKLNGMGNDMPNAIGKTADSALDVNVHPSRVVEDLTDKLDKMDELTDDIRLPAEGLIGAEKVRELGSVRKVLRHIDDEVAAGRIENDSFTYMLDMADANGFNTSRYILIEDNVPAKFSQADIDDLKNKMESKEWQADFDPEAQKRIDNPEIPDYKLDDADVETRYKAAKESTDPEVIAEVGKVEAAEEELSFIKQYIECKGYV